MLGFYLLLYSFSVFDKNNNFNSVDLDAFYSCHLVLSALATELSILMSKVDIIFSIKSFSTISLH